MTRKSTVGVSLRRLRLRENWRKASHKYYQKILEQEKLDNALREVISK